MQIIYRQTDAGAPPQPIVKPKRLTRSDRVIILRERLDHNATKRARKRITYL